MTEAVLEPEPQPPPAGFEPYPAISPFMGHMGTLYARQEGMQGVTVGLWVQQRHLNHQQAVHGGVAASLADNVMSYRAARVSGAAVVTVHLAVDYLAAVKEGDWLEVSSRLDRSGKRLLFLACEGMVEGALVFRAQAVFSSIPSSP